MNNTEIQITPYYHIVYQSDLNPGRIVEVRKPDLVDDFFQHVSGVISGKPYSRVRIVNSEFAHDRISHYLTIESVVKESVEKRHQHFGRLGNSTVLVLPTDNSWMSKSVPTQRNGLGQQVDFNFLIATEMITSSQQDSIGLVVNEALLCLDKSGEEFWVKMRAPIITKIKILRNIEVGANGFSQALQEGLEQIYPDGLPSSGRKRRRQIF